MENSRKKLYIVSFGDSAKYRFEYEMPANADALFKPSPFEGVEHLLDEYLTKEFPGHHFPFLTSAKATEVDPSHADRYADYPLLDGEALKAIEKELGKEAREFEATSELNDNAPYADVNPDAFEKK